MAQDQKNEIDQASRIAVFDLCGTLYFSNTTHDFVQFVIGSDGRSRRMLHRVMNSKYSPSRYLFILLSVWTGWDFLRKFNINLLRGRTRHEMTVLGQDFVNEFLTDLRIPEAHDLIAECRDLGLRNILCSSSIEPVVAAVASKLGFESYVCTTLEYEDGIFTGRIETNVSDEKLQNIRDKGLNSSIEIAISDNAGDLELLRAARRSYAVVHSTRKEELWKKHKIDILYPTR